MQAEREFETPQAESLPVGACPGKNEGMECSDIRYTRSGDVAIAYQLIGDGQIDLLFVTGFVSNLAWAWEHPRIVPFLRADGVVFEDDTL